MSLPLILALTGRRAGGLEEDVVDLEDLEEGGEDLEEGLDILEDILEDGLEKFR